VDIARKGNSKGKRLTQYVESQGWSMQDVMAFGDNYNDISMLEAAGTGVAMGNADDAVKARQRGDWRQHHRQHRAVHLYPPAVIRR
jgi:hydroxymethylpyrimidine pyrophosphatase-like HAD family hydrolase